MRIAHLTSDFLPTTGGAEFMIHNLAAVQSARGHRVTVVTRWPVVRLARCSLPYRVVPLVPTTFRQAFRAAPRPQGHWLIRSQLAVLALARSFDVWHVHMAHPTGWAFVDALRRRGAAALLTSHGGDLLTAASIGYGHRLIPEIDARVRATVARYPIVSAISEKIHEEYRALGVPEARIRDIPNGVDTDRIARHRVDRSRVRARYDIPSDAELVLTVARYDPHVKGLDLVPAVASMMTRSCPTARWIVVGVGCDALEPELERRGLREVVRVIPGLVPRPGALSLPDDRLLDLYRAADVFVFPSRLEGLPLAVLEAMAAGLPVVTSDVPGCRDLVAHGSSGILSPVDDAPALAAGIVRLLTRADERAAMGRCARETAARFSLAAVADAYDAVYAEVAGGKVEWPS